MREEEKEKEKRERTETDTRGRGGNIISWSSSTASVAQSHHWTLHLMMMAAAHLQQVWPVVGTAEGLPDGSVRVSPIPCKVGLHKHLGWLAGSCRGAKERAVRASVHMLTQHFTSFSLNPQNNSLVVWSGNHTHSLRVTRQGKEGGK